jgi:hypothetical protein
MKNIFTINLLALFLTIGANAQTFNVAEMIQNWPYHSTSEIEKMTVVFEAIGEPEFLQITSGLKSPDLGIDSVFRYIISGLVKHYSLGIDPGNMKKISLMMCHAIDSSQDDEVKDFLLQELQFIAGDEVLPNISEYLLDERLCDPAARIFVRVGSEQAGKMLDDILLKADPIQQGIIIKAIGQLQYTPSANKILSLAGNLQEHKKIILRALAEIGDKNSSQLLFSEAKMSGYTFSYYDATGSYLLFLKRSAEKGNYTFAAKQLKKICNNKKIPEYTRMAAFWTFTELKSNRNAVPGEILSIH